MGGLLDIASVILTDATRRVEINAHNVANIPTAGYKRRIAFSDVLAVSPEQVGGQARLSAYSDLSEGKLIETGNPLDTAILGAGFFVVRSDNQTFYTRHGSFRRGADGRLLTVEGLALQARGGGDIVVRSTDLAITPDGMVLDGGEAVARLALVTFPDPTALTPVEGGRFAAGVDGAPADTTQVRPGALEASNVSSGDEMVAMMEALRRAESGQRLVNVYDDLMGRVLSTLGQS